MSTRPEPHTPPVNSLPFLTWLTRPYAGALAMELWRSNRLQGLQANSGAIVSYAAGLPRLPTELWVDVCQWLIETDAVKRIWRYINVHIPRTVQRMTVTMMEIERNADAGHFYQDPETGEIPEASQIRDYELHRTYSWLWDGLESSMHTLYQGIFLFHYARDEYDVLEASVNASIDQSLSTIQPNHAEW